jgi:hypothetical protein
MNLHASFPGIGFYLPSTSGTPMPSREGEFYRMQKKKKNEKYPALGVVMKSLRIRYSLKCAGGGSLSKHPPTVTHSRKEFYSRLLATVEILILILNSPP